MNQLLNGGQSSKSITSSSSKNVVSSFADHFSVETENPAKEDTDKRKMQMAIHHRQGGK